MSIPRQEHRTRSTGKPTPIKYLGLFFGSNSQHSYTVFIKSHLFSPPLKPPIANPGASIAVIASIHCYHKFAFVDP